MFKVIISGVKFPAGAFEPYVGHNDLFSLVTTYGVLWNEFVTNTIQANKMRIIIIELGLCSLCANSRKHSSK